MRRVFVRFLEEIEDSKKAFWNYLTFIKNRICFDLNHQIYDLVWKILQYPFCHILETLNRNYQKNLEEIQDQIAICAKSEMKV